MVQTVALGLLGYASSCFADIEALAVYTILRNGERRFVLPYILYSSRRSTLLRILLPRFYS